MELFRNLRLKAGKSMLEGKYSRLRRKPLYTNFHNIKSMGLVWDASRPEEFLFLSRFHQKMADLNIELKIFGFFPGKELPNQYTAIRYLTCLKKNELDFFYRPVSKEAISFIEQHFDVLVDINFQKLFPLVYITSLSKAGLKVGIADVKPETAPFDLMISFKKPMNLENYLEQVIFYLDMINSDSAKKAV
jgi:hypothetical protein